MLDVLAIRQTSFIDHCERPKGVEWRCLLWGHLRIRLVGYDNNNQPEFVVLGTASGIKAQASAGDKFLADITILSRKPDDKVSSVRDLALGIVLLAVVQGAMGTLLYDVIKCRSICNSLLSSFHDGYYEFASRAAYQNSPMFITKASPTDGGLKHPLDVTPVGFSYRPLSTNTLRRLLSNLGNTVGFEKILNYSL
ncbi:hypothetical protein Unana1_03896 [Umbelopsis nana]